jgi:hypothetical protein
MQIRADAINVFNWANRSQFDWDGWVNGQPNNLRVRQYGNQYTPPRTFFMSMRVFF